jgi:uncharacterized protein YciI
VAASVPGLEGRLPDAAGTVIAGDTQTYASCVATFVFRLKAPRPNFALDMTDEERQIMGRHAAYWKPLVDSGAMVVFGPVLDSSGSWGLGVVEAEDEETITTFAANDPAVTSGTAEIEIGKMLAGYVRPGGPT